MDTRIAQVEVIVYKIIAGEPLFLLVKRVPEKGGFWQPITGGVHENEDLDSAAKRELREETQITEYLKLQNNIHYFEFGSDTDGWLKEYVYGAEVDGDTDAILSAEHSEKRWCTLGEALQLLKYDSNKEAFEKLYQKLKTKI